MMHVRRIEALANFIEFNPQADRYSQTDPSNCVLGLLEKHRIDAEEPITGMGWFKRFLSNFFPRPSGISMSDKPAMAVEYLGITHRQAYEEIWIGYNPSDGVPTRPSIGQSLVRGVRTGMTPRQNAASMLRNLAKTGKVNWHVGYIPPAATTTKKSVAITVGGFAHAS
jgi:hypothetical protein